MWMITFVCLQIIANFMLELLTLMIVIAFNQIWTILKLDQTGGKLPLTPLSVNL